MIPSLLIAYLSIRLSYYFIMGICEGLEDIKLERELNRPRVYPPPPRPAQQQKQKPVDPMIVHSLQVMGFTEIPTKKNLYQRRRKLMRVYHPDLGECDERLSYAINEACDYLDRHAS